MVSNNQGDPPVESADRSQAVAIGSHCDEPARRRLDKRSALRITSRRDRRRNFQQAGPFVIVQCQQKVRFFAVHQAQAEKRFFPALFLVVPHRIDHLHLVQLKALLSLLAKPSKKPTFYARVGLSAADQ